MCGSCACYHSPLMGAPDSICRASGSGTCSPTNPIAPLWARAPRNSGVEPRPSGAAITGYRNPRCLVSTVRKAINLFLAIVRRFIGDARDPRALARVFKQSVFEIADRQSDWLPRHSIRNVAAAEGLGPKRFQMSALGQKRTRHTAQRTDFYYLARDFYSAWIRRPRRHLSHRAGEQTGGRH